MSKRIKPLLMILGIFLLAQLLAVADPYPSLDEINNYNFAKYFQNYLGYYYNSHGCLHFSPSDIYLLYQVTPGGIPFEVKDYNQKSVPDSFTASPFLSDLVTTEGSLGQLSNEIRKGPTKIAVYPSLNRLYIFVSGEVFAQVKTLAGLSEYCSQVIDINKDSDILYDPILSTPTDPGTYTTLRTVKDYQSATYPLNTTIPFGAWIVKSGSVWAFEKNGGWYQVPNDIVDDLDLPYGQNNFSYFDVKIDEKNHITAARWGNNDFGKYALLWTKDKKNNYPEMGYATGDLLLEQTTLVDDISRLLTVPGSDEYDACVDQVESFKSYKAIYEFIMSSGEVQSDLVDPVAASYWRLYNEIPLSEKDVALIDKRLITAFEDYTNNDLPIRQIARQQEIGLYMTLRVNNLRMQKYAQWYSKLGTDWEFWGGLREKFRKDFTSVGIFSYDNRFLIVQDWLNSRLEFRAARWPKALQTRDNPTFASYFKAEDVSPAFVEREKAILMDYLKKATTEADYTLQFESVNALNNFNFGLTINQILGNLYHSHGCLHVAPRSSYILYKALPIGTPVIVYDYNQTVSPEIASAIPDLMAMVNFEEDLTKITSDFASAKKDLSVVAYPGAGLWIIYLKNQPFAKLQITAGSQYKLYLLQGRNADGSLDFEDNLAGPTSSGKVYVFKKELSYISNIYRDQTSVPQDSLIQKNGKKWVYQDINNQWKPLPASIRDDLLSPLDKRSYDYYSITKNASGEIQSARWGSHPFGRYSIITSKNKKTAWPELIHTSGDLMMEERRLVQDLIRLLTAPADRFEDCLPYSQDFMLYKDSYNFDLSPEASTDIVPEVSGRYKLFFDLPLSTQEAETIPDDIELAHKITRGYSDFTAKEKTMLISEKLASKRSGKIVLNMEKIRGMEFDTYAYVVSIKKYANHYAVVRDNWQMFSELRSAILKDFSRFMVKDPNMFGQFTQDLMLMRKDIKRITQKDAYLLLNSMLNSPTTRNNTSSQEVVF